MTTIKQLIDLLMQNEDLEGEVLFEYYTKDNFEQTGVSNKLWSKIAAEYDEILVDDGSYQIIEQAIKRAI